MKEPAQIFVLNGNTPLYTEPARDAIKEVMEYKYPGKEYYTLSEQQSDKYIIRVFLK